MRVEGVRAFGDQIDCEVDPLSFNMNESDRSVNKDHSKYEGSTGYEKSADIVSLLVHVKGEEAEISIPDSNANRNVVGFPVTRSTPVVTEPMVPPDLSV